MKFGPVPLAQAEGAILAHSVATPAGRLRKGRVIGGGDLRALRSAGMTEVTVARLDPEDVHEDAAARRIGTRLLGDDAFGRGLRMSKAATGRVNIYAEMPGVVDLNVTGIRALNAVHPMITLATVPPWQHMGAGGMIATVKIISYGVPGNALAQAEAAAEGALRIRPLARRDAVLIETVVEGDAAAPGQKAIAARLAKLGLPPMRHVVVPHRQSALADALSQADADLILILTGSATSDENDTAPAALRQAGGQVERFGMPVDPGNLLFLGTLGTRPVIGLPGCARSPALNGADWVLERVACGVAISGTDIAEMGVGGLLKEIPSRPRPREGPGPGR